MLLFVRFLLVISSLVRCRLWGIISRTNMENGRTLDSRSVNKELI